MIVEKLYRSDESSHSTESVELTGTTVLVGPNNVGKTQTLRDIRNLMIEDYSPVIFDNISYLTRSFESLLKDIEPTFDNDRVIISGQSGRSVSIEKSKWQSWKNESVSTQANEILRALSSVLVRFLDASSRLNLATESKIEDHQSRRNPQHMALSLLYSPDKSYNAFRRIFEDVFGVTPIIDYSDQGQIRIQVGEYDGDLPEHPRKLGELVDENGFSMIDGEGDGYLSFAGVVGSLLISKSRLLLLDEPAAFLHPSQARRLGEWIANKGSETTEQIVISTHDSNFLNGMLEAPEQISIYRLNRYENQTQFTRIATDTAQRIATEPLLRSQRVLDSAFHTGIIICEGGSDRVVYEAVARYEHGETEVQFVDGLGLSSLDKIARAAANANIPVAAIVDLDILNPHRDLTDLLRGMMGDAEYSEVQPIIDEYDQIKDEIETLKNGIGYLSKGHQETVNQVVEDAASHGVYLAPCGELEDWMDLSKSQWVEEALEAIFDGECDQELVDFIGRVINDVRTQYQMIE